MRFNIRFYPRIFRCVRPEAGALCKLSIRHVSGCGARCWASCWPVHSIRASWFTRSKGCRSNVLLCSCSGSGGDDRRALCAPSGGRVWPTPFPLGLAWQSDAGCRLRGCSKRLSCLASVRHRPRLGFPPYLVLTAYKHSTLELPKLANYFSIIFKSVLSITYALRTLRVRPRYGITPY